MRTIPKLNSGLSKRCLHLQEYQSKQLMAQHGVNTQRFKVVDRATDIERTALDLNAQEIVIKAQVLAGGRGKGVFLLSGLRGGVHLSRDAGKAALLARQMLGYRLVTAQTDSSGLLVKMVMLAEAKDLAREAYFAILLDRETGGPMLIGSARGGVDIESHEGEDHLVRLAVRDVRNGPSNDELYFFAQKLEFSEEEGTLSSAVEQMSRLYRLFIASDATQIEVNPLGVTPNGQVLCFDAKIAIDDSASFRQKTLFEEACEESGAEAEAKKAGLSYIALPDGNIGCLVNGAGLAMATMDLLALHGASPANFLDVGGSASAGQVLAGLRLLAADSSVKAILVNIFGGIMRCDAIAEAILKGHQEGLFKKRPLVVRFSGTNADIAAEMLKNVEGLELTLLPDLDKAAQFVSASQREQSSLKQMVI